MSEDKDALIEAQKQVIGILFNVVKCLQDNNELDEEYLGLVSSGEAAKGDERLLDILHRRRENSEKVAALLKKLEN